MTMRSVYIVSASDANGLRLRYRIASFRYLTHRVALKLFAEIGFAHHGLLSSFLGKKASTILGAIQFEIE